MKKQFGNRAAINVFAMGAALLTVTLLSSPPAASQNTNTPEKGICIGCSVDGKTTPRTGDGHPDLSGYWGGGGQFANQQFERSNDGSILFDFATTFNGADYGGGQPCADDDSPRCSPQPAAL
jgi:hypothetical protein